MSSLRNHTLLLLSIILFVGPTPSGYSQSIKWKYVDATTGNSRQLNPDGSCFISRIFHSCTIAPDYIATWRQYKDTIEVLIYDSLESQFSLLASAVSSKGSSPEKLSIKIINEHGNVMPRIRIQVPGDPHLAPTVMITDSGGESTIPINYLEHSSGFLENEAPNRFFLNISLINSDGKTLSGVVSGYLEKNRMEITIHPPGSVCPRKEWYIITQTGLRMLGYQIGLDDPVIYTKEHHLWKPVAG